MEQLTTQEKKHKKYNYGFLTKSLLILSILTANPQGYSMIHNKQYTYEHGNDIEHQTSKRIIEESIKKTISELKSLEQLPLRITYPIKGIKNAPDIIDINPKKISAPIDGISITLGKRTFYIEPIFGQITAIRLEEREEYQNNKKIKYKVLLLETTYLDKEYSEQKLWKLCNKLLETPEGQGEKSGFKGTKVRQL